MFTSPTNHYIGSLGWGNHNWLIQNLNNQDSNSSHQLMHDLLFAVCKTTFGNLEI